MDILETAIDSKRNIKANSLVAYLTSIKKLHGGIVGGEFEDLDFLDDTDKVLEWLSNKALSTQKNYIAAIIVSLDAMNGDHENDELIETYRGIFDKIQERFIEDYDSGEKSKRQEKNWVSMIELKKAMARVKLEVTDRGILKKTILNNKELMLLQRYVITNLYLTPENPPTRLDYAPMEVISAANHKSLDPDEEEQQNYLVVTSRNVKHFHFNEYKTSATYGENIIKVGKKLNSVLNIWLKFNTTDSLLLNTRGGPLSPNGLGKQIKLAFISTGKDVSVNILRHVFLSEKYPREEEDEREADAKMMGHSVAQQKDYSKRSSSPSSSL